MGKRNRRGGFKGAPRKRQIRADYVEVQKSNELYEKFYNELIGDDEKEEFWAAIRRDLPISFRFTGSKGHALAVKKRLEEHYVPQITSVQHDGQTVSPPAPVPWYPDELAWQMTTPKTVIRKFPPFASFKKFLVSETNVGNITRQELVSMIPPLLLDVRPGMIVLDLCAAPGSKSAQLIEMVHAGEEARLRRSKAKPGEPGSPIDEEFSDWDDGGRATGLLVANDVDYKRAHMLIHQMKRLNSPNLIVTNHDARHYPTIRLPSGKSLKFDRVLADVPCSGDGTPRKNVNVWKDWGPGNALGLQKMQIHILVRALQLLKVGGRVVYSTCSMNPVENEAVVAAAIEQCGGLDNVDIIDASGYLDGLKKRPGLKTWKVMGKQGDFWSSWKEVEAYQAEHGVEGSGKVLRQMFPPDNMPLERCMRVYAHQQDTGSFFIAILEKRADSKSAEAKRTKPPITATIEELESKDGPLGETIEAANDIDANPRKHGLDGADDADNAPSPKRSKPEPNRRVPFEESFKFLDPNHEALKSIYSFYSLDHAFPRDRFMVRNAAGLATKTIYYASPLARDILVENEGKGIKFVHCGVKMFVRQDTQSEEVCGWRIQAEGLPLIESFVGDDRIIRLHDKQTFRALLIEMFPKVTGGGWTNLGEIGERVRDISMGCCVLRIEKGVGENSFSERIFIPVWRSLFCLNLMLPKEERKAMLLRLYDYDGPLINHNDQKAKEDNLEPEQAENAAEADAEMDVETERPALENGSSEHKGQGEAEPTAGPNSEQDFESDAAKEDA